MTSDESYENTAKNHDLALWFKVSTVLFTINFLVIFLFISMNLFVANTSNERVNWLFFLYLAANLALFYSDIYRNQSVNSILGLGYLLTLLFELVFFIFVDLILFALIPLVPLVVTTYLITQQTDDIED